MNLESFELLSDFDETMIKEPAPYREVFNYFFWNNHHPIKFIEKVLNTYCKYKKTGDVRLFYSLLKGCPVELVDSLSKKLHINPKWMYSVTEELSAKNIGIASRNDQRIIQNQLQTRTFPFKIGIAIANIPEIQNGFYTGKSKIFINNDNLAEILKDCTYLCGKEEERILKKSSFMSKRLKSGLYICKRRKWY